MSPKMLTENAYQKCLPKIYWNFQKFRSETCYFCYYRSLTVKTKANRKYIHAKNTLKTVLGCLEAKINGFLKYLVFYFCNRWYNFAKLLENPKLLAKHMTLVGNSFGFAGHIRDKLVICGPVNVLYG